VTIIYTVLVALASEASFVVGLLIGSIVSAFAALMITAIRGSGRLSALRAILQGTICGLFAGTAGLWAAISLGRALSLPDQGLFWLAVVPPFLGEFGHFLNRFSLRHMGKPDAGVFVPLGRLHGAAWEPFRQGIFHNALEVFRENEQEDIPALAAQKAIWFTGRACLGLFIGAVISMWWLAGVLHLFALR
jgi:hypothetical protein